MLSTPEATRVNLQCDPVTMKVVGLNSYFPLTDDCRCSVALEANMIRRVIIHLERYIELIGSCFLYGHCPYNVTMS
jgi:hypothetical protein